MHACVTELSCTSMPPQHVAACKVDDQCDIGIVSGLSLLSYHH